MLYIGIDPGKHTGWAEWDSLNQCFIALRTLTFWQTHAKLESMRLDGLSFTVYIEAPQLNKAVFGKNKGYRGKNAQNVGMNKKEAMLLLEYLIDHNIPHVAIKPTTSKWTDDTFENITRWDKQSSQHSRDAAKLVIGLK